MRVVFLGSGRFSLPTLEALLASGGVEVVAVVAQPDRPAGRGHAATPPVTKELAQRHGVTVLQPDNVNTDESLDALRALHADVFIVAAYGQILRQALLDIPSRGSLNVHASLLPRHRGASPVAAAILTGDDVTGVSILEVVRALDAGPVVARREEPISPEDTTGSLQERLSTLGASLLMEVLQPWFERRIEATPQDEALVTYAPQIKREDARIDWAQPAVEIWRRVRAFNPWPVAYTTWRGEELRILEASPNDGDSDALPGTVIAGTGDDALVVQTGHGQLALRRVQRPGRNALSGSEFLRGQRDIAGGHLGE